MDQNEKKGYNEIEEEPDVHHFHVGVGRKILTHTHKKCNNDKHCGQVDGYHCLKELILVEIGCVADNVQYYGWYEDVQHSSQQLSS